MRPFLTTFAAACLFFLVATPSDAARGTTKEELLFVANTPIVEGGQPLALCHLVTTRGVFFINLFRSMEQYALAANNCMDDGYYDISSAEIMALQAAGELPADLPLEPKMSTGDLINGHWGWGLVLGVIGFVFVASVKKSKRASQRAAMMGNATPAAQAILDAMCHAAKCDGSIDPSEIEHIRDAAQQLTGQAFSSETVRQMAELAETKLEPNDFKKFLAHVSPEERTIMMQGVLRVVAADGNLAGPEQQFVGQLAGAMGMSGEHVNQLLGGVLTEGNPQPA